MQTKVASAEKAGITKKLNVLALTHSKISPVADVVIDEDVQKNTCAYSTARHKRNQVMSH